MTLGNKKVDAVVVGTGISAFAAATALKQRGKEVLVLAKSPGATALSSGAWDFGPISSDLSFAESFAAKKGKAVLEKVLVEDSELFSAAELQKQTEEVIAALTPDLELSFHPQQPIWLPTTSGTWKPTYLAQSSQAGADLKKLAGKKVGVVNHPSWRTSFESIANTLQSGANKLGVSLSIQCENLDLDASKFDLPMARVAAGLAFDKKAQEAMLSALRRVKESGKYDLLLLPPVIPHEPWAKEILIGSTPVAEMLGVNEPTPGYRLHQAMLAALARKNIEVLFTRKIKTNFQKRRVSSLVISPVDGSAEWVVETHSLILATGKFLGGGVQLGYDSVHETVLGLPLFAHRKEKSIRFRNELDWVDRDFALEQDWAHLGLWVDARYRPQDEVGEAVFENVHACGSVIGGTDFAKNKLGLGFFAYMGRRCASMVA